jgi:hypothetical protein
LFGTLKLRGCCGSDDIRDSHQRYYCGLCQAMGAGYGLPLRALHSYDGVFVALLADGLQHERAAAATTICPMLPVVRKASVDPESPAMVYAAAVQLLLGDQWLADKQVEGGRTAGAGRRLLAGRVARARARLSEIGVDLCELVGFEQRQDAVERTGASPEQAAEPTAGALELVFGRIADLPGAQRGARGPLTLLGRHLGRAIYLVDALEDCDDDARDGDFNPCLTDGEVDADRVEAAVALLDEDLAALASLPEALPLLLNRELVAELIGASLTHRSRAAIAAGRRAATGVARADRARHREMSIVQRLSWAAAALLVSVWSFFARLPEALASWDGATTASGHSANSCGNNCGNNCGNGCCNKCGDNCGENCGGCNECCDSCKGCGDSCQGCTESCEGCCNSCPGTALFFGRRL